MFRATMCPSSRGITVSMRHLVFVTLCGWLIPDSHPYRMTNTKCSIDKVISPDDGHIVARNKCRKEINILKELCTKLALFTRLHKDARSKNIKNINKIYVYRISKFNEQTVLCVCLLSCLKMPYTFTKQSAKGLENCPEETKNDQNRKLMLLTTKMMTTIVQFLWFENGTDDCPLLVVWKWWRRFSSSCGLKMAMQIFQFLWFANGDDDFHFRWFENGDDNFPVLAVWKLMMIVQFL